MGKERLAETHRLVGEQEHAVERRMLDQADQVPDPERMRKRARAISDSADRHLAEATRLRDDEPHSAQDPQDTPQDAPQE